MVLVACLGRGSTRRFFDYKARTCPETTLIAGTRLLFSGLARDSSKAIAKGYQYNRKTPNTQARKHASKQRTVN